jgi:hypothetical protein
MSRIMNRLGSLASLVAATVLASCGKDALQTITDPAPAAAVRFFNYGVNAPGVNFYANETKMTAITSSSGTESTTGVVYGSAGAAGNYSGIAPGQYTLAGKIAAATDKDLAIATAASTIADGKYYSFYMSGLYDATAKTSESFVVEDPFPAAIGFDVTIVRFVNAISNSSPMTLYAKDAAGVETAIGTAVTYKNAGTFVTLAGGFYDLNVRLSGSSTNAISATGVSLTAGHVYTVAARGDMTVTSSTSANRPILTTTANR